MNLMGMWAPRITSAALLACTLSAPTTSWAQSKPEAESPPTTTTTTPAAAPPAAASVAVETKIRPAQPKPPVERRVTTPVLVSGIVAGVAVVTGTIFAISAASQNSKYKDQPDHEVALDGESAMFIANVSFGIGALFGLTALALYFLPDEPTPTGPAAATLTPRATSWVTSALKGEVRF